MAAAHRCKAGRRAARVTGSGRPGPLGAHDASCVMAAARTAEEVRSVARRLSGPTTAGGLAALLSAASSSREAGDAVLRAAASLELCGQLTPSQFTAVLASLTQFEMSPRVAQVLDAVLGMEPLAGPPPHSQAAASAAAGLRGKRGRAVVLAVRRLCPMVESAEAGTVPARSVAAAMRAAAEGRQLWPLLPALSVLLRRCGRAEPTGFCQLIGAFSSSAASGCPLPPPATLLRLADPHPARLLDAYHGLRERVGWLSSRRT
eukprot:TRINITY_DN23877_c0_g1_i2.p1 TRINITY_DN23877_c0_g1~~TRINITY_DN23877_c0_g1_i2.p1  ORF type:complete len:261 (+),score=85.16 TRINITY_DN23877_c0_g1_i2:54-836(+)